MEMVSVKCQVCGTKFKTKLPTRAKWCSNACKSRMRRAEVRYEKWRAMMEAQGHPIPKNLEFEIVHRT